MTTALRVALGSSLLASAVAGSLLIAARGQDPFPHAAHAGLFPLCVGCHLGVETGDRAEYYPAAESCLNCHDGEREARVTWIAAPTRVSNLDFDHVAHALITGEDTPELTCQLCHTQQGAPRMQVEPPIPQRCFDCHDAHPASEHFVDAQCVVCHVPLAESELPPGRVAALPVPDTHLRDDFLSLTHGELAMGATQACVTCHVQEQCTSCHVAVLPGSPIAEVPAAAGRVAVTPLAVRYPLPASHLDPNWERLHGHAASPAACATCHTQDSCTSCHLAPLPPAIAALPRARDVSASGAAIARRAPESHASPFFATRHGPLAVARPQTCATCHERRRFCADCHEPGTGSALAAGSDDADAYRYLAAISALAAAASDTPPALPAREPPATAAARGSRGFHPPNYVLRHSAEAFGRRLDCSSCHNTQRFCRDCHLQAGRGSAGRLGTGYHDAEPIWLLRHGQAARQTLESCTSCHVQRDCMQCHSQLGAFRVSPHGPGFDARRAQRANPQICRACHLGDPLAGS
jgi:hypothetical protein